MTTSTLPRKTAKSPSKSPSKAARTAQRVASSSGTRRSTTKARKSGQADLSPLRFVVSHEGIVIHTCGDVEKLLGLKAGSMMGVKIRDVIDFVSPEDALRDRPQTSLWNDDEPSDSDTSDPWVASISSGTHEIVPVSTSGKTSKSRFVQFDHVSIPGKTTYLVASILPNGVTEAEDDLKNFVLNLHAPEPAPAPSAATAVPAQADYAQFLGVFAEMGHDFLLLLSARGKLVSANSAFYESLGLAATESVGLSFLDLIHPEDRPYIQPVFKNIIHENGPDAVQLVAFECRIIGKDESVRWLECRIKSHDNHLMVICRDQTGIKRNEADLLRHQQQLSEAQSIGHMGHWTWRIGDDVLEFSSEIYRIFGVAPESFIPTLDNVNGMMHRRDRGRMSQAFQRAMIERKTYEMEFRVIRPSGEARFILLQGRCEMDQEGDVTALFGIMQDITERTQHERELREAVEAAERAYAAKSQFLANMSHELRTPLNAIIGFSEMIGRQMLGPIGTEKYLDYITGIRESGEHLLDLITDILDMSKIEAGKYTLDVEDFNLSKVLRLAIHMIEGRALDAQVKVSSTIPDEEDLHMTGDRRAIMQMILNILSNSVKFTEPGGSVTVACETKDTNVVVTVTDTGIGIPSSKLPYVMKPFEQAANHFTRNHEGSGLGLAITKELAELHGGSVAITSKVGVGTRVVITLPIKQKS
ncbi:MAG: ATP-binding protein [Pseudobdellovibrionaceae bacterium]